MSGGRRARRQSSGWRNETLCEDFDRIRLALEGHSAIRPCFWSRTPRIRGAANRQARRAHPIAKTCRAGMVPANGDVKSLIPRQIRSEPLGLP